MIKHSMLRADYFTTVKVKPHLNFPLADQYLLSESIFKMRTLQWALEQDVFTVVIR